MIKGATRLVGVDVDSDSIDFASQRFGRTASFYVGSMEELDFPADSFDVVSCLEGIEHVPVPVADRFLSESYRLLGHGGELFLSSPHCTRREHSGNPYHIHEYQPDEIREKIARHFVIEETIVQKLVDDVVVHYFRAVKR
jgi:ubiquinone/menaquinone biosynthesis C-methylase UbiE